MEKGTELFPIIINSLVISTSAGILYNGFHNLKKTDFPVPLIYIQFSHEKIGYKLFEVVEEYNRSGVGWFMLAPDLQGYGNRYLRDSTQIFYFFD